MPPNDINERLTALEAQSKRTENATRNLIEYLYHFAEGLHRTLVTCDDYLCEWRGFSRKPRGKYKVTRKEADIVNERRERNGARLLST